MREIRSRIRLVIGLLIPSYFPQVFLLILNAVSLPRLRFGSHQKTNSPSFNGDAFLICKNVWNRMLKRVTGNKHKVRKPEAGSCLCEILNECKKIAYSGFLAVVRFFVKCGI